MLTGWAHDLEGPATRLSTDDAAAEVARGLTDVAGAAPVGGVLSVSRSAARGHVLSAPLRRPKDAVLMLMTTEDGQLPAARTAIALARGLWDRATQAARPSGLRTRLDDLVTDVATALTGVAAHNLQTMLETTLAAVGAFLEIDTCFLRRNDFAQRASVLVAEWPRRQNVPEPDPLGIVSFDADDPVFAAIETLDAPLLLTPSSSGDSYQKRISGATGLAQVSLAMVPLRPGDVTEGVLGFVHFGSRTWTDAEVAALRVIAGMLAQVLARVDAESALHTLAYHDVLTGLPNRRLFLDELEHRLAAAATSPFTLLFLDLDRLKTTNDIFGHAAGDALIRASAQRLAAICGDTDLVARLSGDEFVLILDGIDSTEVAREAAASILADLRVPLVIDNHPIHRSASIGAATSASAGGSLDKLLRSADMALLEAKSHGGDEAVVFNEVLDRRTRRRDDLELRLSGAIDDGEFELFYQPEFDLKTRRITGVEALARWNHPERGLITAAEFMPVIEETNRSRRLGRWALQRACAQLAAWSDLLSDTSIRMRVNFSPGEFLAADFIHDLQAAITSNGLRPNDLCLEITENSVIRDVPAVVATLHQVRAMGVEVAIDDFGTGHSSLAQLKDLPVDTLKIDTSFVIGIEHNPSDQAIVAGILALARSFALDTVVEGVETEAAAEILLDLGCRRAQGYLLAPPVPAHHMTALLRADRGYRPAIVENTIG